MAEADRYRGASDVIFGSAVLVCAGAALFLHLDLQVLSSPHEARVLEAAREMEEAGDHIVPRYLGQLRAQKPPLAYWAATCAGRIAGEPSLAWTRRIVAGLGLLTLVSTLALGTALFDRRTAVLAAAALGSSLLFVEEFRKATSDPFLASFSTAAAAAMAWAWRLQGPKALLSGGVASAALALALLGKGPIALLFAALAFFATRPSGARIRWLAVAAGLVAALLPLGIWAYAVAAREPEAVKVWGRELWARMPGSDDGGAGAGGERGPWIYVTELALGLVPVTGIFAVALALRPVAGGTVRKWFLFGLLALAAMPSRKAAYLLPLLPAAALLVARVAVVAGPGFDASAASVARAGRAALSVQAAIVPVAAMGVFGMLAAAVDGATWWSSGIGGALLLITASAALAALFRQRVPVRTVLLAGLLGTGLWAGVHRAREPQDLSRFHLGRFIYDRVPDQEPLLAVGTVDPVLAFYARRVPATFDDGGFPAPSVGVPCWILASRSEGHGRGYGEEMAATLSGFRQGSRPGRAGDAAAIVLFRRPH